MRAGRTVLLEGAEASDGNLLALGDLTRDGVEHGLERVLCSLLLPPKRLGQGLDELALVH